MTDPDFWYLSKGVNIKLSEHFESAEFDCHCHYRECTTTVIKKSHVELLEKIRWNISKYYGSDTKLIIDSGNRCERYNKLKRISGKPDSRHLPKHGDATDCKCQGLNLKLAKIIEQVIGSRGGFKYYQDQQFFHCDSRGYPARW